MSNEVKNSAPEEVASENFRDTLPIFKQKARLLGGNAAIRVLEQLIEFPLNAKNLRFLSKVEEEVFALGMKLLSYNRVIVDKVLKDKKEQAELAMKEEQTELAKQAETKKEGDTNV